MTDYELFLGFRLSDSYLESLEKVPIERRSTFIQDHPDYLQQACDQGASYLGKRLGDRVEFSSLEFIQAHIYSVLKCLVPENSCENHPLVLFSIKKND